MYSRKNNKDKKNDYQMNIGETKTRKKLSDYLIFLLIIAVICQLVILIYRIALL